MALRLEVEVLACGGRNDTFQQRREWEQWCREISYLWWGTRVGGNGFGKAGR